MDNSYKNYVGLAIFAVLVVVSLIIIRPIALTIILGTLLAYLFYPLYKKLQQKIKNPVVSSLLICLAVFLVVVIPASFMMKTLVEESYVLYLLAKQKLAVGFFQNCTNNFCSAIENFANDPTIRYQSQEIIKIATDWIIQRSSQLLISLPKILVNLFVLFFVLFYFLKDGHLVVEKASKVISLQSAKYKYLVKRLREITHGLTYGYLLVALIQGALGAIGFLIFGVSSPIFWGLVMAFLALFPYLGTFIVWFPAALILFLDGIFQDSTSLMVKGILLFLYGALVISSIDNILKPKLMGEKAKVHPTIVMLGIIGGLFVFGTLGILIGPLVLSITSVFVELYFQKT